MSDGQPSSVVAAGAGPHAGPAGASDWAGAPLRSTIRFLALPAILALLILVLDLSLPSPVLYGLAAAMGLLLVSRMFRDPEWLLAVFILYIPLTRQFVAGIAPGVNGTNVLLALLLAAWAARRSEAEGEVVVPNARLVRAYAAVSVLSVVTAGLSFGFGEVLGENGGDIKGWVDQFIVFFTFVHLIRDGAMARRVVLYMMLGAVVVLALGFNEWLDKRWMDSIEKARLLGPQMQPNDFGAFLVYIAGPFIGLLLIQLRRPRTYLLAPYFLTLGRMLLATFSRGAFIGAAVAGVAASWVRGRAFLLGMGLLAAGLLIAMPQLIPESLAARMSSTVVDSDTSGELDASSGNRLVLWKAAVEMTLESPVLGKGFKAFPRLKAGYTEIDVREADNHNMFLYLSSQMGLPALALFVWLLWRTYRLGASIYRAGEDVFARAIGLGAVALAAGVAAVNMFGSRMVDMSVCAYFWIYLAALAHLWREVEARPAAALRTAAGGGST